MVDEADQHFNRLLTADEILCHNRTNCLRHYSLWKGLDSGISWAINSLFPGLSVWPIFASLVLSLGYSLNRKLKADQKNRTLCSRQARKCQSWSSCCWLSYHLASLPIGSSIQYFSVIDFFLFLASSLTYFVSIDGSHYHQRHHYSQSYNITIWRGGKIYEFNFLSVVSKHQTSPIDY